MSLWDGLGTDHRCQVIGMRAMNHPQDFDSDIIGRMPMRFHVNQSVLKQTSMWELAPGDASKKILL